MKNKSKAKTSRRRRSPGKTARRKKIVTLSAKMATSAHAGILLRAVGMRASGCALTCRPTLVSCDPVGPCVQLSIPDPGCSPLECSNLGPA